MSKKILLLVLICFIFVFTSGCQTDYYLDNAFMVGYLDQGPFLINQNNEQFSLNHYDEIIPVFGDILTVGKLTKQGMRYGFIRNNGKEIIKPIYEQAHLFNEGKAVVTLNGSQLIINTQNNVLYQFPDNVKAFGNYVENKLIVQIDHQYTYLNQNFELGLERFDFVTNYHQGFASVGKFVNNKMKYTHIDHDGNIINDYIYDFVDNFYNNLARVGIYQNNELQYHFINSNGAPLKRDNNILTFAFAKNFSLSGYAICAEYLESTGSKDSLPFKYKKYEIIDIDGSSSLKKSLDSFVFGTGTYFLSIDDNYQELFTFKGFKDPNGIFLVKYNQEFNSFLTLNLTGFNERQIPNSWQFPISIDSFKQIPTLSSTKGYARIQVSSQSYGIIDSDGTYIVEPIYHSLFF